MIDAFFRLDMKAAAKIGGCFVCAVLSLRTERYLQFFLNEHVLDPNLRLRLISSQGFCNAHGWQLVQIATKMDEALGVATIYEHLTEELRQQIQRALLSTSPIAASKLLQPQKRCPLCEHTESWERDTLASLLRALENPQTQKEAQKLYAQTGGLCLPHLRQGLLMTDDKNIATFLLQEEDARLQRLHINLAEFCRKHDYRFHDEPMSDDEKRSWLQAIETFVGKREMAREQAIYQTKRRGFLRWQILG